MITTTDPIPLENHLQRILKSSISLNKNDKDKFRQHYDNVSEHMIQCMKQRDNLFQQLYQVVKLAGSYADKIKVTAPNEFDALILLKFPAANPVSSDPGFVTINISGGMEKWSTWVKGNEREYRDLVVDCYVTQDGVLEWVRKLIAKILAEQNNIFHVNGAEYLISHKNSGPAVTLKVNVQKSSHGGVGSFSIDLVPALEFQVSSKWVSDKRSTSMVNDYRYWNAIPKPNNPITHNNRNWTCSYAEVERDLLNDRNKLKPLIRIFKKIRDKVGLTKLKSFYIKTIFLHQRLERPDAYWNQSFDVLMMDMFDVFLEHFKTKTLWSLWHNNCNLLEQLAENQRVDIYNKLKNTRETFAKNIKNGTQHLIYKQLLTTEEISAMEQETSSKTSSKTSSETTSETNSNCTIQ